MRLMTVPDEKTAKNKKNFLSRVFIKQQIKLGQCSNNHENRINALKEKETSECTRYLPLPIPKNREEIVYRRNGKSVEKIHEFDFATGAKVQTTHYDYFNDKKIRSVDEFDIETGKIIRTTNFILYKSVDEYDVETGKKQRTINYSIKDENKISSIQEYDPEFEKITKVYIYRKDSNEVSIVKELNPENGKVVKWTSYKDGTGKKSSVSEYDSQHGKPVKTTYFYEDGVTIKDIHEYNSDKEILNLKEFEKLKPVCMKSNYKNMNELDSHTKERMAKLIDNLFQKNHMKFECI